MQSAVGKGAAFTLKLPEAKQADLSHDGTPIPALGIAPVSQNAAIA